MEIALDYLGYAAIGFLVLSLIACLLLYLNTMLERSAQLKREIKTALRIAEGLAMTESSAAPYLPPLPTYDEVIQVEQDDCNRFKQPHERELFDINLAEVEKQPDEFLVEMLPSYTVLVKNQV